MAKLSADVQAAVRKYGPSVNNIARQYGISGEELLAKLVMGESGGRRNAVSPAGARAWTQFMPGSRKIAMQKFGIDPWRSADEAVHAAALHLEGKINGSKGLKGYNPGDPSYTNYILNQKVGGTASASSAPPVLGSATGVGTASYTTNQPDVEGAIISALELGPSHGSLFKRISANLDSGQYTTPVTNTVSATATATAGTPGSRRGGDVSVSPSANRKGQNLKPYVLNFANAMSQIAGKIDIGTGTNHSRMTVNGKVSDHWDGSAMDIPATGKRGDEIAFAAFRAAGVDAKQARRWASNGGLYNVTRNGVRYQIIWKTNEGGNHYNHVHVGVRPR